MLLKLVYATLVMKLGRCASEFAVKPELLAKVNNFEIRPRACPQASPHPDQTKIFLAACDQNPQNSINACYNQLFSYANRTATTVCHHYYNLYEGCVAGHPNDASTACSDAGQGYLGCTDFTLQAYAYCGCYFNLPDDIYECANVQLEIVGDVEPTSSVSLLPFTGTITTTLGTSPIGPMISVAPNPKGASVLAFGGAPAVLTTTVTISSVYTTTVGGSPSLVTGVTTSAGLTTSYPGSSPTFLPPPQSTKGGPAGGTLTIVTTFPTTEVYTTTSEGSTYPVTTVVEATKTILSCAGGCQATTGASATETVCVRRKQTRVFRRDEI